MATATTGMAGFLTRVRGALADDGRADAELVREYLHSRSDTAFAELVRRFAPMVWGVCRRTVRDTQLAEDAFQAVFLVLVRKADSIRPPAAVGGWLHGVAVNTSTRARAMIDRRRKRQSPLDPDHCGPPPQAAIDVDELRVLDEEIARLPDTLRAAVALCELDGVSRRDAAKRLGVAEGTLSSRLATARKQLAARLRARGAALPVGGLAALLASGTAGAVPPVIPTPSDIVSALADGAIRTMFLSKLKVLTAGLLAAVALLGVGLSAYPGTASEPRPPVPTVRRNAPIPVPKATEERILVGVNEEGKQRLEVLTPKGVKVATIDLPPHPMYHPALSRDGKRVAVWSWDAFRSDGVNPVPPGGKISHKGTLLVYDIDKPDKPLATLGDFRSGGIVFAPDGQSLYVNESPEPGPGKLEPVTVSRFDLKTLKKEKVAVPAMHSVADISADGKTLLTNHFSSDKGNLQVIPHRVPLDTLKAEPLSKSSIRAFQFSPDGSRVLAAKIPDGKNPWKQELVILNLKDGKETPVTLDGEAQTLWGAAWSRDGKKLLVNRLVATGEAVPQLVPQPIPPGGGAAPPPVMLQVRPNKPELTIRNLDGSEPKPLLAELKANSNVFGLDWK